MKKITLFFVICCFAVHFAQAQSFVFEHNGVELPNNASYAASEVETFPILVIESNLGLVNKTENVLNIEVTQTVLQAPVAEEAFLSICFDQCFVTNSNKVIQGQLPVRGNTALHCYFNPVENINETVVVKYEVKNLDNPTEKITVTITYLYGTSGVENQHNTESILFSGKSFLYSFAVPAVRSLQIFDVTGKCISEFKLKNLSDKISLDIKKGIYVYRLTENGKALKTSKVTIF